MRKESGEVPRKPTIYSRDARDALIAMIQGASDDTPLPPLRELGKQLDVHPTTVFRILRDLVAEGVCWQSPGGRFFPSSARRNQSRGAPVCFVGRELWQWSRLYREILEGVSEVCEANESPLVVFSSRCLVRQASALAGPRFATPLVQSRELKRLLPLVPKGCMGVLLDHVWEESALEAVSWPGCERVQLLHGANATASLVGPDWEKGGCAVRDYAGMIGARRVGLVHPFASDPAIDRMFQLLRSELDDWQPKILRFQNDPRNYRGWSKFDLLVCPEDNIAEAVAAQLPPGGGTRILGTQGTGVLQAPHARLRYDYRRLGRAAVSLLLWGTRPASFRPSLIDPMRE